MPHSKPLLLKEASSAAKIAALSSHLASAADDALAVMSSRTSATGSDIDFDDVKSTTSSHPFSSPNPSEVADDHALPPQDPAAGDLKKQIAAHKRKKLLEQPPSSISRLAYPLSERQQLALLMQMTAPEDQPRSPMSASASSTPGSTPFGVGSSHHSGLSTWPPPSGQSPAGSSGAASSCGASLTGSATKSRGKTAKIFRRNDRGETLLHVAAKRGDERQCLELIKEGSEVNAVDYAGWTPLHEACNKGWVETAEILIQHGANVNASGMENDTPLHDAALNGNKSLLQLLLENGADPLKANAHNKRPVDVAEEQEIIDLLMQYISKHRQESLSLEANADDDVTKPSDQSLTSTIIDDQSTTLTLVGEDQSILETSSTDFNQQSTTKMQSSPAVLNYSMDQTDDYDFDNKMVIVEDQQDLKTPISPIFKVEATQEPQSPKSPEATLKTEIDNENTFRPINVVPETPSLNASRPKRRIVTPTRLLVESSNSATPGLASSAISPRGMAKKRRPLNQGKVLIHGKPAFKKHGASAKSDRLYRSHMTPSGALTLSFNEKLGELRNKKRKLGQSPGSLLGNTSAASDVYEFHSSDSEIDPPRRANQPSAKVMKILTEDPSTTTVKIEQKDGDQVQTDQSLMRGRSISYTTLDLDQSQTSQAGLEETTPSLCSRKERLLGARRKKGVVNLSAARFEAGVEVQVSSEEIVNNTQSESFDSAIESSNQDSTSTSPSKGSFSSTPSWRRCSMFELSSTGRPSPVIGNRPTLSTSPKVPPIKLILANATRTPGPNTPTNFTTIEENEETNSATYFVREAASITTEASQRVTRSQVRLLGNPSDEPVVATLATCVALVTSSSSPMTSASASPLLTTSASSSSLHPRKRKIKANAAGGAAQTAVGSSAKLIEPIAQAIRYSVKPSGEATNPLAELAAKNTYEAQHELQRLIHNKWQVDKTLCDSIQYTKPRGFDKFLMNKKTYLLQAVADLNLSDDDKNEKEKSDTNELPAFMKETLGRQEKVRQAMTLRHQVERERLIMACENEALRVHCRVVRGTMDPHMSAMRVLRDGEIYNSLQLEKTVATERYSESSSINDILQRFSRSKNQLVGRQKLESDCLFATQFEEWIAEYKIRGNLTPEILKNVKMSKEEHQSSFLSHCSRSAFPQVVVKCDFDLLPSEMYA